MPIIDSPDYFRGQDREGLRSVYDYLLRMSDQLNQALNNLTLEQFIPEQQAAIGAVAGISQSAGGARESVNTRLQQQVDTLKAYIIKTADTVRYEMDSVFTEMVGSYDAESSTGTYSERWRREVEETAQQTVAAYTEERLLAVESGLADFATYELNTEQYITTGYLYDEAVDGVSIPRYGVMVQEAHTSVNADGETVWERSGLAAAFTSDKLSFRMNGQEVAYLSNNTLYIQNARIMKTLDLGHLRLSVQGNGAVIASYNADWA